jgi:hypothetical protein
MLATIQTSTLFLPVCFLKIIIRINKTIILPVVLYGCETWSLILRLRVFENRVLRRIYGPNGDEVTGGWRKLHNEELQNLYSSPSIIRVVKSRSSTSRGEEECV